MATTVDTLLVRIESDLSDLRRDLNQFDKRVKDSANRSQSNFNKIANVAKVALGAVVVHQAARAGLALVNFVSHVDEMQAKSSVVFGEFAGSVREQLAAFGAEVGRSQFALEEMAASVQDTFVPMGFARGEAAQLSVQLAKLATDVASFNNASDAETMAAFQSAIVGNHETVRRFGIVITEATLNQELLRMGINKTSQNASNAEKVQARLNLILAGTTDAQGDAARTADSYANQTKALQAALELLAVEAVGPLMEDFAGFVGVLTDATNGFRDFLKIVGITPASFKDAAGVTDALRIAKERLAIANDELYQSELALQAEGGDAQDTAGQKRVAVIEAEIAALEEIRHKLKVAAQARIEKANADAEANKGEEQNAKAMTAAKKAIDKMSLGNKMLRAELLGVQEVEIAVSEIREKHKDATKEQKDELEKLIRKQFQFNNALAIEALNLKTSNDFYDERAQKQEDFIDKLNEMNDAITLASMEAGGATEAELLAQKIRQENKDLSEEQIAVLIQQAEVERQLAKVIEANADAQSRRSDQAARGVSFIQSLKTEEEKLIETQEALKVAFAEGEVSEAAFRQGMGELQQKLMETDPIFAQFVKGAEQAGDAIADSLAESFMTGKLQMDSFRDIARNFVKGLIAEFIKTYIIKRIMANVMSFAGGFAGGGAVSATPATEGSFAGGGAVYMPRIPRRATGGAVLVGERGPELFVPNSAGSIKNKQDTRNLMANAGNTVVVNQSLNFSTGIQNTVRAEVMNMLPTIQNVTVEAVREAKQKGGSFANVFGG